MADKKKLARVLGMIMFVLGFIILLVNALDYLGGFFGLSSDIKLPSSGIDVVFLVLGFYMQKLFPLSKKE